MNTKRWGIRTLIVLLVLGVATSIVLPILNIQNVTANTTDRFGVVGRRSEEQMRNAMKAKALYRFLRNCIIQYRLTLIQPSSWRASYMFDHGNIGGSGFVNVEDHIAPYLLEGAGVSLSSLGNARCDQGGVITELLRHINPAATQPITKFELICNPNTATVNDDSGGIFRPVVMTRNIFSATGWDINYEVSCYGIYRGRSNTSHKLISRARIDDALYHLDSLLVSRGLGWVTEPYTSSEAYFVYEIGALFCGEHGRSFGSFAARPSYSADLNIELARFNINERLAVSRGGSEFVSREPNWHGLETYRVKIDTHVLSCESLSNRFNQYVNTDFLDAVIAEIREYMRNRCQQQFAEWIDSHDVPHAQFILNTGQIPENRTYYVLTYRRFIDADGLPNTSNYSDVTFHTAEERNAWGLDYRYSSEDENGNVRVVRNVPSGSTRYNRVGNVVAFWTGDQYEAAREIVHYASISPEDIYNNDTGCNLPDDILDDLRSHMGSDTNRIGEANDCRSQTEGAFQWMLCPAVDGGLGIIEWFMNLMGRGLAFNVLAGDESAERIRDIWSNFLTIANILFAIVFMVIIYSTATSTGLKNYDIKKIMPRLVIAAILVNTSFWIAAGISDLINILGHNIKDLITAAGGVTEPMGIVVETFWTTIGIVGAFVLLLLAGLLAPAVLAILLMIALLTFRNVAIVFLIIISPIAFVLWLLPNTEKYFKMWLTNYIRMLLVYPIVMAGWGICQLLAEIIRPSSDVHIVGPVAWVGWLILQVAPVAIIIPAFKMGGSLMGKIQGMTQKGINKTAEPYAKAGNQYLGGLTRNKVQSMARKPVYNEEKGQFEKTNRFGRSYKVRNNDKLLEKHNLGDGSVYARAAKAARKRLDRGVNDDGSALTAQRKKQLEDQLKRAKEGMAASVQAYDDASKPNFLQRGLGTVASVGTDAFISRSKELDESAKANTDSALKTEEYKLDLKHSAASLRTELEKQQIEMNIKANPEVLTSELQKAQAKLEHERNPNLIGHEARMRDLKAQTEGPTESSREFKVLTEQLTLAEDSGNADAIAAAASARDAFQSKITDAKMSAIQNAARVANGRGANYDLSEIKRKFAEGNGISAEQARDLGIDMNTYNNNGDITGQKQELKISDLRGLSKTSQKVLQQFATEALDSMTGQDLADTQYDANGNIKQGSALDNVRMLASQNIIKAQVAKSNAENKYLEFSQKRQMIDAAKGGGGGGGVGGGP